MIIRRIGKEQIPTLVGDIVEVAVKPESPILVRASLGEELDRRASYYGWRHNSYPTHRDRGGSADRVALKFLEGSVSSTPHHEHFTGGSARAHDIEA